MSQSTLEINTIYPSHDYTASLYDLVMQYKRGKLMVPAFQRNYVWSSKKAARWMDTVRARQSTGVFVTYRLNDNSREKFLSDGLQRITATIRAIDDPQSLGIGDNSETVAEWVQDYHVNIFEHTYNSHGDALRVFQNINLGTGLTSLEYFKGEFTESELGMLVWERIPAIIERATYSFVKQSRRQQRRTVSAFTRDCFGQFLQFISGNQYVSLWNVFAAPDDDERPVETELMNYIRARKYTKHQLEQDIERFSKHIDDTCAVIRDAMAKASKQEGVACEAALARWCLHTSTFRKNTEKERTAKQYNDLIAAMMKKMWSDSGKFSSRFMVRDSDGTTRILSLQSRQPSNLHEVCAALGSDFYTGKRARKTPGLLVSPGFQKGHIKPFVTHGNGPVIAEPASINMSRGAQPIEGY